MLSCKSRRRRIILIKMLYLQVETNLTQPSTVQGNFFLTPLPPSPGLILARWRALFFDFGVSVCDELLTSIRSMQTSRLRTPNSCTANSWQVRVAYISKVSVNEEKCVKPKKKRLIEDCEIMSSVQTRF